MKPRWIAIATATILLVGAGRGYLAAKNRESYPCSFRTSSGQLVSLQDAKRAREKAVRIGESTGVSLNTVTRWDAEEVIRCVAKAYNLNPRPFIEVARCESGMNPGNNTNPLYKGLYQYHPTTWANASKTYSHAGASIFDGYSQIHVTVQSVRDGGWGPWPVCGS